MQFLNDNLLEFQVANHLVPQGAGDLITAEVGARCKRNVFSLCLLSLT